MFRGSLRGTDPCSPDLSGFTVECSTTHALLLDAAGRSAYSLILRGFALEVLGFLCIVPIVLESYLPGPTLAWGSTFVGLGLILVTAGVTVTLRAYSRVKVEKAAGYATLWKVAKENPSLVYIDSRDGLVIASAGEPRPPSGRRADIESAKARHQR
jgi:hypothetical protein